jgi:3-oxoacyl-[acyl-carrier-protein] synthase II
MENSAASVIPSAGRRRVVVTGIGMVTPLGLDRESSWTGISGGVSPAGPVEQFDASDLPVTFACEVKGFDPTVALDRKTARRSDRFVQFAITAAREAVADGGLEIGGNADPDRIGTSIATGIGGLRTLHESHLHLFEKGGERMSPMWITMLIPNMASGMVSMELGTRGPAAASCTACAASSMAIGDAACYIRDGRADLMLAGGTEAPITGMSIGGFYAMRAISMRNDDPAHASRPFDAERDGFVIGEGSSVLLLEELEHARARGACIYGELIGYGLSSDALHVTEPDPTGRNPARAMQMAIAEAGIEPSDIGYINAHGTSTPLGDAAETRVIKRVLGEDRAARTPVSSTKSMTGHMLGAAGATEAAITLLAMTHSMLPPTINQLVPDPQCDLDYIPNEARQADVAIGLSNGFGFGGHNACLVLRRWDEPGGRRSANGNAAAGG